MDFKKLTREVFMLCLFLLLFAITPGFGKLNLEDYNIDKNGGWNRLTDETLKFKNVNCGFDVHCADAPAKKADIYSEENGGFLSTLFIN